MYRRFSEMCVCLFAPLDPLYRRDRGGREGSANWRGLAGVGTPSRRVASRKLSVVVVGRAAPVISGACNRSSAGDKKPAENEIRITVVGPGPDNGRIMMTPAPIALRYHGPPRPADHIFPAFFLVSLPPPTTVSLRHASLSRIEISIQSCAR